VVAACDRRRDLVEAVRRLGPAVQHDDGRQAARPPVEVVERAGAQAGEAVDGSIARP
jgi:hypothetical protein